MDVRFGTTFVFDGPHARVERVVTAFYNWAATKQYKQGGVTVTVTTPSRNFDATEHSALSGAAGALINNGSEIREASGKNRSAIAIDLTA